MANIVRVQTVDDVKIEHTPTLFTVRAKGTHNWGASNARLVPMFSEEPKRLLLGFYVDQGNTTVMTPVSASLEFEGEQFAEVCVVGEKNKECRPVFE
jgi:hypothetical protein